MKPHDRDDLAVKTNEPASTALDNNSDPDATIAAICAAGPAECEKRFEKEIVDRGPVHSSVESLSPQNMFNDTWIKQKKVNLAYGLDITFSIGNNWRRHAT